MKKKLLIVIIFLLLILGIFVAIEPHKTKAIVQAELCGITNKEYSEIKRGFYCGEGGVNCRHREGYIYACNDIDIDTAMAQAVFNKDGNNQYTRNYDRAKIIEIIKCIGGYLICYDITGTC